MAAPTSSTRPRLRDLILIALFVGMLWLPLIDSVFHIDRSPAVNENRETARPPVFTGWAHIQNYIQGIQTYYDDHFGFRKSLVRWHSSWKRKLFHEAAVRDVIIGRDGWLYTAENQMIENFTRLKRFSDQDLAAWQKLYETRRDWLAARGIKYQIVIAPDKHTVYPENLPEWLKSGPGPSKLDQLLTHMHQHSTVSVLDLRPALNEAKQREPVYLMTDTHWNLRGAFFSYQALITTLAQQFPGLVPLSADALKWENIPAPGDLAIMLGQENAFPEKNRTVITGGLEPLQFERTSLPSAKRVSIITTRFAKASGRAIVYHDSFGDSWFQFLGRHFGETIYISKRIFDPAFIEEQKPVVVIDQIVERILNVKDPAVILADDNFPPAKP